MNVVIIFTYDMSLRAWEEAGIIDRELNLYKQLAMAYGYRFTFVTFGDSSDMKYVSYVPNSQIIPIYKFSKYRKTKVIRFIKSFFIFIRINKMIVKPNLIKTNQLMGFWVSLGIKFRYKCPLIIRTGYDIYEFSIKDNKSFFKKSLYYFLTQIGLLVSDVYSVTTNANRDFINKNFFLRKKKLIVTPNWVSKNMEINKFKDRKNAVISVGRMEKQKNYTYLIEEFADTNISISIIGEGSQKKDLEKFAIKKNTDVSFLKKIPNSELIELLSNYKYFVLPSTFEGNPKVVMEAMAAGCVVLVNNFPGIDEIVTNEVDGYVFDAKRGRLLNLFSSIANNEQELAEVSQNAVLKIDKKFSLNSYIEVENRLYLNLIDN